MHWFGTSVWVLLAFLFCMCDWCRCVIGAGVSLVQVCHWCMCVIGADELWLVQVCGSYLPLLLESEVLLVPCAQIGAFPRIASHVLRLYYNTFVIIVLSILCRIWGGGG